MAVSSLGVLGLRSCWTAWHRGPISDGVANLSSSSIPVEVGRTAPFLGAYWAHVGHTAMNCHFCLRCGKFPRDNRTGFQDHLDGKCYGPPGQLSASVLVAVATLQDCDILAAMDHHRQGLLRALVLRCQLEAPLLGSVNAHGYVHEGPPGPLAHPPAARQAAAAPSYVGSLPRGSSLPCTAPQRGSKRAGPLQPAALHRGRANSATAGMEAQREAHGRAALRAAFSLGTGMPGVIAGEPVFLGAAGECCTVAGLQVPSGAC